MDLFFKFANRAGRLPASLIVGLAIVLVGACSGPIDQSVDEDAGEVGPTEPPFTVTLKADSAVNKAINWGAMTWITVHLSEPAICKRDGDWLVADEPNPADESIPEAVRMPNPNIGLEVVKEFNSLTEDAMGDPLNGPYALVGPGQTHKYTTTCTGVSGRVETTSIAIGVIPRAWSWIGIAPSSNEHEYNVQPKCGVESVKAIRESEPPDPAWDGVLIPEWGTIMDERSFGLQPTVTTKYSVTCVGAAVSPTYSVVAEPR